MGKYERNWNGTRMWPNKRFHLFIESGRGRLALILDANGQDKKMSTKLGTATTP
jgi:hypothetical protein